MIARTAPAQAPVPSTGTGVLSTGVLHPASQPAYLVLLLAFGCVGTAVLSGRFTWDAPMFARALIPLAVIVLACWLARARGMGRLFAPVEMYAALTATIFLMAFVGVVAVSSAPPMIDDSLRWADRAVFGFDRDAFVAVAATSSGLMAAARWIYLSLGWTPQVLLIVLTVRNREGQAWALMTALLVTMVICVASVAVFPAYGTPPYAYRFVEVLDGIRDGTLRRFDDSVITGMVTFPSMHAAYGLILAKGAMVAGRWCWPIAALNVVMIATALLVGGHYLVDIIAGCAVAWLAIRIARLG